MVYKILVVGLSRNRGGVESYIMNMVKRVSQDRFKFYFPANGAEVTYGNEIRSLGGRFIAVPRVRGWHFVQYYWGWWQVLRKLRFDVIYWNDCSIVSLDVLRMARLQGVPVRVFHAHSSSRDAPLYGIRKWIENVNFRNLPQVANVLLACSETAARWMFRPHAQYRVIPNAIEVFTYEYFSRVREETRKKLGMTSQQAVCFVGHLSNIKNPLYFVKVASAAYKLNKDCAFYMIGSGELEAVVGQLASDLGLPSSQFRMLGTRSDVPELLQAMDCLVMPSRYEGLPMTLVEAQASGLPCVVSDAISRECDLTGDVTFLSLKDPVKHWADVILQRLQEPRDRTQGARKVREAGFDAADAFPKLEQLILDKLRENRN